MREEGEGVSDAGVITCGGVRGDDVIVGGDEVTV